MGRTRWLLTAMMLLILGCSSTPDGVVVGLASTGTAPPEIVSPTEPVTTPMTTTAPRVTTTTIANPSPPATIQWPWPTPTVTVEIAPTTTGAPAAVPITTPSLHPLVIDPYVGSGTTVAMLGDSLTSSDWGIKSTLGPALQSAGYAESITGLPGYTMILLKPWADLYAATAPKVVVVNLGTNDAAEQWSGNTDYTLALFEQRVEAWRSEFRGSCVVFTTITDLRPISSFTSSGNVTQAQVDLWNTIAASYDGFIRTLPNVADWEAALVGHPEYVPDGVHPWGTAGRSALTDVLMSAVRRCGL